MEWLYFLGGLMSGLVLARLVFRSRATAEDPARDFAAKPPGLSAPPLHLSATELSHPDEEHAPPQPPINFQIDSAA